jgi:Fe-S-cluster containining protein
MHIDQTNCTRCGICCEKGGPALHGKDLEPVLQKQIMPEKLYTLRKGELVYDNVRGGLIATDQEIVKVKSLKGAAGACIFYNPEQKACRIYEVRPAECRIMACWDTKPAEALYGVDRLDRAAIFGQIHWLMDLTASHEEKCGYDKLDALCRLRQDGDRDAAQAILESVRYDVEMRRVVEEKTGLDVEMMDLIFGRPLEKTLPDQFGVKLMISRPA